MTYANISIDQLMMLHDDGCCFPCDGDKQECEVELSGSVSDRVNAMKNSVQCGVIVSRNATGEPRDYSQIPDEITVYAKA